MSKTQPVLKARYSSDTCAKCKSKVEPGERVAYVMIVAQVSVNPSNPLEHGFFPAEEFEVAHVNCHDTHLEKGLFHG